MAANASYVNELFNIKTALPRGYFGHFMYYIVSRIEEIYSSVTRM